MMKRKFLAVFLPIIGTVAVVGSGFSAWYFGTSTSGAAKPFSDEINVDITEVVNNEGETKLTIDTNAEETEMFHGQDLYLDQGGSDVNGPNYEDSGILFSNKAITGQASDYTAANGLFFEFTVSLEEDALNNLTLERLYDAGMELKIAFKITLPENLAQYIKFQDNVSLKGSVDAKQDLTLTNGKVEWTVPDPAGNTNPTTSGTWEWTFKLDCSTTGKENAYKNALFTWVDTKKPTDMETFTAMDNALTTVSPITFGVTATIA